MVAVRQVADRGRAGGQRHAVPTPRLDTTLRPSTPRRPRRHGGNGAPVGGVVPRPIGPRPCRRSPSSRTAERANSRTLKSLVDILERDDPSTAQSLVIAVDRLHRFSSPYLIAIVYLRDSLRRLPEPTPVRVEMLCRLAYLLGCRGECDEARDVLDEAAEVERVAMGRPPSGIRPPPQQRAPGTSTHGRPRRLATGERWRTERPRRVASRTEPRRPRWYRPRHWFHSCSVARDTAGVRLRQLGGDRLSPGRPRCRPPSTSSPPCARRPVR